MQARHESASSGAGKSQDAIMFPHGHDASGRQLH